MGVGGGRRTGMGMRQQHGMGLVDLAFPFPLLSISLSCGTMPSMAPKVLTNMGLGMLQHKVAGRQADRQALPTTKNTLVLSFFCCIWWASLVLPWLCPSPSLSPLSL